MPVDEERTGRARPFDYRPGQPAPETAHSRAARIAGAAAGANGFAATACIGAAGILVLKTLAGGRAAALWSCAVILWYAWTVNGREASERGTDVIDSVYYLGFLFTLTSLGLSLYQAGGGEEVDAAAIVGDFGIAIGSTMTGMAARIWLTMRRGSATDDVEDEIRASLNEAAAALQSQIRYAVEDFRSFREGIAGTWSGQEEALRGMAEEMRRAVAETQAGTKKLAEELQAGQGMGVNLRKAGEVFAAGLKSACADVEHRVTVVRRTAEQMDALLESARKTGKAWDGERAQLARGSAEAADALQAAAGRIRNTDIGAEVRRALETAAGRTDAAKTDRERSARLEKKADAVLAALEEVKDTGIRMAAGLKPVPAGGARTAAGTRRAEPAGGEVGGRTGWLRENAAGLILAATIGGVALWLWTGQRGGAAGGAPAPPEAREYASCEALRGAGWSRGLNRDGGTYGAAWDEAEKMAYARNTDRDGDRDGIACE